MQPELAPISFIAAFSLVLPLPWHWRAGNVATLSIIAWLFALNMIHAIDSVIWADNVNIVATVWCDITTKLITGANFALPAACLCICIHLERVASMRPANTSMHTKRRKNLFEGLMCWGLPVVYMALHYVVQGHRFDIIEAYGCRSAVYFSIPAILIIYVPTILMSFGALIFAGLALRHFIIRRLSFAAHLSTNSVLTTSRYIRLMAMAALQMFWSLTTTCYALWFTVIAIPLRPWTTWDDVHSDFLRIDRFPTIFTPAFILRTYYVLWWLPIISTFLFVAFFSFGKDATDEYKKCFEWIKTCVFRFSPPSKGFMRFSYQTKTELPISSPTFIASSNPAAASCTVRTSKESYCVSSPTSDKTKVFGADDSSEFTHHLSGTTLSHFKGAKAVGSMRDLSAPQTPLTALPLYYPNAVEIKADLESKPLPKLPPSYPGPRCASARETPVCPRPFTYPSNHVSHQDIDPTGFTKL